MRGEISRDLDIRPSSVALWTGILSGPIAWAALLQAKYSLVTYACTHGASWLFWAITVVALIITAFGAYQSWRGWKIEDDGTREGKRARFMGICGLMLCGVFALTIIANSIPEFFLHACE
jgi:hypothetical protein